MSDVADIAKERCETCRFCVVRHIKVTLYGEPTGDTLPDPECRRNPPGFYMNSEWSGSVWPSVKADDWCGAYHLAALSHEEG